MSHSTLDINECRMGNGGCSHGCQNLRGGYRCTCWTGYDLADDLHSCEGW